MIVVTGAAGQLGLELRKKLAGDAIYLKREDLDLCDVDNIRDTISALKPKILINAAAYNAVDKAESETRVAFAINAEAPGILSELSKKLNFKFIHVSTDYVFDGAKSTAYRETDRTNPINAYGSSKLKGEQNVLNANPSSLILRTSWVHSRTGRSFLNTVLHMNSQNKPMRVVDDIVGSPTWAHDLAEAILKCKDAGGIFHYSNEGLCSWYDFACAIKLFGNLRLSIEAIPSSQYPTIAKRPKFSLLDKSKIKSEIGISIPHWMESVEQCLKQLS